MKLLPFILGYVIFIKLVDYITKYKTTTTTVPTNAVLIINREETHTILLNNVQVIRWKSPDI